MVYHLFKEKEVFFLVPFFGGRGSTCGKNAEKCSSWGTCFSLLWHRGNKSGPKINIEFDWMFSKIHWSHWTTKKVQKNYSAFDTTFLEKN